MDKTYKMIDIFEIMKHDDAKNSVMVLASEPGQGMHYSLWKAAEKEGIELHIMMCARITDAYELKSDAKLKEILQSARTVPGKDVFLILDEVDLALHGVAEACLKIATKRQIADEKVPENLHIAFTVHGANALANVAAAAKARFCIIWPFA